MAKSNADLSKQLVAQGARMTPVAFDKQMHGWYSANKMRLETLAGSEDNAKRIMASLLQVASRSPQLLECTQQSLGACVMQSAALKLFPGPMQECAYVPFRNGKTGKREATFMPMYQGLVKMAFNSGFVKKIGCDVVYEKDGFDYELGTQQKLRHKPYLGPGGRGERICAYAVITTRWQEDQITVVPISFIESIKSRSRGAKMKDSPWNGSADDYDAMARKTVLKQALKMVPKSPELAEVLAADNESERPDLKKPVIVEMQELSKEALEGGDAPSRKDTLAHAENTPPEEEDLVEQLNLG